MLNIAMYDIVQNNFTETLAMKDCNYCTLQWANQEEKRKEHLVSSTFALKRIF